MILKVHCGENELCFWYFFFICLVNVILMTFLVDFFISLVNVILKVHKCGESE